MIKKKIPLIFVTFLLVTPTVFSKEVNRNTQLMRGAVYLKPSLELEQEQEIGVFQVIEKEIRTTNQQGNFGIVNDTISILIKTNKKVDQLTGLAGLNHKITFEEKEGFIIGTFKILPDQYKDQTNITFNISLTSGLENIRLTEKDFKEITYYAPIDILGLSFLSNNQKDNSVIKNGDEVILDFKTNHGVVVEGKIYQTGFKSEITESFKQTYKISEETLKDKEELPYEIKITDRAGNTAIVKTNKDTKPITYFAPIQIEELVFNSLNEQNHLYAKDGDKLLFRVKANHSIRVNDLNIAGETFPGESSWVEAFESSVIIKKENRLDQELMGFTCTITDPAGNVAIVLKEENKIRYFAPVILEAFEFSSQNIKDKTLGKIEDTLILKTKTNHKVTVEGKISGETFTLNEANEHIKTKVIKENEVGDNQKIPYEGRLTDEAGNTLVFSNETQNDQVVYYAPIDVKNLSFTSNNQKDNRLCKNNDQLKLCFETSHPVDVDQGRIASEEIVFESKEGMDFIKTMEVLENQFSDQEVIDFSLTISDKAGNRAKTIESSEKLGIRYFAPLIMSNFGFMSNNSNAKNLAKNGDILTLEYETNHHTDSEVLIGETLYQEKDKSQYFFTKIVLDNAVPDNQKIPYEGRLTDHAGNTLVFSRETKADQVTYYAPIDLKNLSFTSNNQKNNLYAKNGDVINLNFQTTHPIGVSELYIGGIKQTIETQDELDFKKGILVSNQMVSDQTFINLSFKVRDAAGNMETITKERMQGIKYYAPIQALDLKLNSNNKRNSDLYLKDGDRIFVSFRGNHPLYVTGMINENLSAVSENNLEYTLERGVQGDLADQAQVSFNLNLSDAAGNTPLILSQGDVFNELRYYAPIQASSDLFSDNEKNSSFAKAGDTVTASISGNHEIHFVQSIIQGRKAQVSGALKNPTAELKMGGSDPEGLMTVEHLISDVAGNLLLINQAASAITYDRTLPQTTLTPDMRGFTNKTISMSAHFSDAHLDTKEVSLKVNDKTQGIAQEGNDITQIFSIALEDEYEIFATATDHAGNKSQALQGKIIIDKTNPEVTAIDINLAEPTVFKAGFKIADHFKLEDQYLKSVECQLTSKTAGGNSTAWEVDTPIVEDGLKTISLKATDMSSNESPLVTYDFYIDGTPPKPIVKNMDSDKVVKEQTKTSLKTGGKIGIALDKIWIGNEAPDEFTRVEIINEKTGEAKNIIEKQKKKTSYEYAIKEEGAYRLSISAVDQVKNTVENLSYPIKVTPEGDPKMGATQGIKKENLPFIIGISVVLVLIFAGVVGMNMKKKRTEQKEGDEI